MKLNPTGPIRPRYSPSPPASYWALKVDLSLLAPEMMEKAFASIRKEALGWLKLWPRTLGRGLTLPAGVSSKTPVPGQEAGEASELAVGPQL